MQNWQKTLLSSGGGGAAEDPSWMVSFTGVTDGNNVEWISTAEVGTSDDLSAVAFSYYNRDIRKTVTNTKVLDYDGNVLRSFEVQYEGFYGSLSSSQTIDANSKFYQNIYRSGYKLFRTDLTDGTTRDSISSTSSASSKIKVVPSGDVYTYETFQGYAINKFNSSLVQQSSFTIDVDGSISEPNVDSSGNIYFGVAPDQIGGSSNDTGGIVKVSSSGSTIYVKRGGVVSGSGTGSQSPSCLGFDSDANQTYLARIGAYPYPAYVLHVDSSGTKQWFNKYSVSNETLPSSADDYAGVAKSNGNIVVLMRAFIGGKRYLVLFELDKSDGAVLWKKQLRFTGGQWSQMGRIGITPNDSVIFSARTQYKSYVFKLATNGDIPAAGTYDQVEVTANSPNIQKSVQSITLSTGSLSTTTNSAGTFAAPTSVSSTTTFSSTTTSLT